MSSSELQQKKRAPKRVKATGKVPPRIEVQRPTIREPNVFDSVLEIATRFYEVSIKGSKATLKEVEKLGLKEKLSLASRAAGKVALDTKDGAFKVLGDGNRVFSKASKLAKSALDFEDDDAVDSADYDLLLSAAGHTVVYKCRIKKGEIGFAIREIRQDRAPTDIKPMARIRSDATVQGEIKATTRQRSIALIFDNKKLDAPMGAKDLSLLLKAKTVCFWVSCGELVSLKDESVGLARDKEVEAANHGPIENN